MRQNHAEVEVGGGAERLYPRENDTGEMSCPMRQNHAEVEVGGAE